jgi:hypothetical protein
MMQIQFNFVRTLRVLAVTATALVAACALPTGAAIFAADQGAGCDSMTLAGRTITCGDGTRIAIDASVTPGCAQFALGREGADYTLVCATPNATGMWWRAEENGRGTWLSHQGDTLFGVDFAYDGSGAPRWRTLIGSKRDDGTFAGDAYTTNGPPVSVAAFDAKSVWSFRIGGGWIALDDPQHLSVDFSDVQARALVPLQFGPLPACAFGLIADPATVVNYTDLWWNPGEAGWGIGLTHQGDTLFVVWFTYDSDGSPLWFAMTANKTGPGTYAGDLYRTVGPVGPSLQATAVGNATLSFASGSSATFTYSVQLAGTPTPVVGSKPITRQIFSAPGTACQ